MKTKHVLLSALLFGALHAGAQDLEPGINYSYNPPGANGIITNITVDVVNNDNNDASSFDVAMYLYDPNTQNVYVIGTTNIPSLSGNSVITINNWNIDINQTAGIPAGTYRLGEWVDSNDDVSETDENNNAGLLSGNINYTPSTAGVAPVSVLLSSVKCFPNPANDNVQFSFTLTKDDAVALDIFNTAGQLVQHVSPQEQLFAGAHSINFETVDLPAGVYFVTLTTGEDKITQRLVVVH